MRNELKVETFWRNRRPTRAGWILAAITLAVLTILGLSMYVSSSFDAERQARLRAEGSADQASSMLDQALARTAVVEFNPTVQVYSPPDIIDFNPTVIAPTVVVDNNVTVDFNPTVVVPTPDDPRPIYYGGEIQVYRQFDDEQPAGTLTEGMRYKAAGAHFFVFRAPNGANVQMVPIDLGTGTPDIVYVDNTYVGLDTRTYAERIRLQTIATNAWAFGDRYVKVGETGCVRPYNWYPVDAAETIPTFDSDEPFAVCDGDIAEIVVWGAAAPDFVSAGQPGASTVALTVVTHIFGDDADGRDDEDMRDTPYMVTSAAINLVLERPRPTAVPTTAAVTGGANDAAKPGWYYVRADESFNHGKGDRLVIVCTLRNSNNARVSQIAVTYNPPRAQGQPAPRSTTQWTDGNGCTEFPDAQDYSTVTVLGQTLAVSPGKQRTVYLGYR
jgi:hypothetical protein